MKKWLILIILFSFQVYGFTQTSDFIFVYKKVAYVAGLNEMHVEVMGYSCKSLIFSTNDGRLEKSPNSCWFNFYPRDTGLAKITVMTKNNKKLKEIGQFEILVKDVNPFFHLPFAQWNSDEISKSTIASVTFVNAETYELGCTYYFPISLDSFTVTVMRDQNTLFSKVNMKNRIDTETNIAFQNLKCGDKILFSNIYGKGPDRRQRLIKSKTYSIIE